MLNMHSHCKMASFVLDSFPLFVNAYESYERFSAVLAVFSAIIHCKKNYSPLLKHANDITVKLQT